MEPPGRSPDVAKQFLYAWSSGKASLGEGPEAEKAYKLDTVGDHVFKVAVKRTVIEAGRPALKIIGEKAWTVKVVSATPEFGRPSPSATRGPSRGSGSRRKPPWPGTPPKEAVWRWSAAGGPKVSPSAAEAQVDCAASGTLTLELLDSAVPAKAKVLAKTALPIDVASAVSVRIVGTQNTPSGEAAALQAVVVVADPAAKASLTLSWTDETRQTGLGKGEKVSFSAKEAGSYTIRVEARDAKGCARGASPAYDQY